MAVPFRRVSSTRRNKRRTHDKLSAPTLVVCPECGEYKMSHRVCKDHRLGDFFVFRGRRSSFFYAFIHIL